MAERREGVSAKLASSGQGRPGGATRCAPDVVDQQQVVPVVFELAHSELKHSTRLGGQFELVLVLVVCGGWREAGARAAEVFFFFSDRCDHADMSPPPRAG